MKYLIIFLLFLLVGQYPVSADEFLIDSVINFSDTTPKTKNIPQIDTFTYKYHFQVGDTIIYAVMSRDSIIINGGDPLLRIRSEKIMLTCDSITSTGNFIIKQQLIQFNSRESNSEEKNVPRNHTPGLNYAAYMEIDSLGRRYNTYHHPDSLMLAMAPGGPFQPFIIFPLENNDASSPTNKKFTNESGIVKDTLLKLSENGNPYSALRATCLYRVIGMSDTLDLGEMLKMTFAITSQGAVAVKSDEIRMLTTSINNAGGEIYGDTTNGIPKYYFHTIEQRLTIEDKSNKVKEQGFHFIHSTFVLDTFIRK